MGTIDPSNKIFPPFALLFSPNFPCYFLRKIIGKILQYFLSYFPLYFFSISFSMSSKLKKTIFLYIFFPFLSIFREPNRAIRNFLNVKNHGLYNDKTNLLNIGEMYLVLTIPYMSEFNFMDLHRRTILSCTSCNNLHILVGYLILRLADWCT